MRGPTASTQRGDLPTGTVTFLFSDIEGSTRLVQDLGPDVFRGILEEHHALLRRAFAEHNGVERGTQGDSFAVIFREGPAAVAAAVAAQRSLAGRTWPAGGTVRVRMGLHTGLGVPGGDDYVGVDIHRAARIAGLAAGGQTLMSEATRVLVERDLPPGAYLRDLGRHRLRDLALPEHLFEVAIDGLTPDFPPLRTDTPGNLPPRLTSFVGRELELADLGRLLADARLLTVTGPGGIGKTSLALELARRSSDSLADGAWLVRLDAVADAELVMPTIADALGLPGVGGRAPFAQVAEYLADRHVLLVLDNLEQVRSVGSPLAELLERAGGLRVLATSRVPLNVSVEQTYPVGPLPVDGGSNGDADAVRLFVDRARRGRPDFRPDADERAAIAAICRRLDGLPLGIELAAASVRLLPPRTILARLDGQLELPGASAADLPARHRTLRDTVAWSHDLLDGPARELLAGLSVFVGGCRLDEAEAVAGATMEDGPDTLTGIATLTDHSLVVPRAGVDGPRFVMYDTIRTFARERLDASGTAAAARRRHAEAYLALAEAEAAYLPGRDQAVRLGRLGEDHDNLRAAVTWTVETGDADMGLRFAAALWRFWQLRGHLAEAHAVLPALLAIPGADRDDALRLRAMEARGGVSYWRGEMGDAAQAYEEQIRIAREIGDRSGEADGWFNVAHVRSAHAEAGEASQAVERAAALYEELGNERGLARVAWARSLGALVLVDRHDVAWGLEALDILDGLRRRFEALDDFLYEELCVGSLAWAHLGLGNLRAAADWGRRGMRTSWATGDVASTTFELRAAAVLAAASERWVDAATLVGTFEGHERRFAVRPPVILEEIVARQDTARLAREHLGPAAFEAARAAGQAMTLDEAVDYALRVVDALV